MNRDPFYNDIIAGLEKQIDPELFEQCACDILRQVYPGLVPIKGGSDSGRDGAIANIDGTPIPLTCTTQEDVIGNFTKSLNSYLKAGLNSRKVVSVTSRNLTTRRKDNLKKRAEELGFTLLAIHDQPDVVNRLYENPKWCAELLNITGNPPALSFKPLTRRPFLDIKLLGREKDLEWLSDKQGDLLIVGQPGSGKTYLQWDYANINNGLFVRNHNIDEIVKSFRKQQPEIIILDDAHNHLELISHLLMLRQDPGLNFRLIANCWPFFKDKVLAAMQIPDTSDTLHELKLLTRDTIVEIVHACGIGGPNQLIAEIVSQSAGKPGLATTFCLMCKQGGVRDVVLGETIKREIKVVFESTQENVLTILGIISLGGNCGMDIDDVSTILGISRIKLHETLSTLSAGGILDIPKKSQFAVIPETLRYFLVRETFFERTSCFDVSECLSYVNNPSESVKVLLGAMHRDANIPHDLIKQLLVSYGTEETWKMYAWLGRNEVKWILENHSEKQDIITEPALYTAPDLILPYLLKNAVGNECPLHSTLSHPLRKIEDWIVSARPGSSEPVIRRKALLDAVLNWLDKEGDLRTITACFKEILNLNYRRSESDPGSGMKISIISGCIRESDIDEIQKFWPKIFRIIKEYSISDWVPIKEMVDQWLYPYAPNAQIPDSIRKKTRAFGRKILIDLMEISNDNQGVLRWIKSRSKQNNLRIEVHLEKYYELIFPIRGNKRDFSKEKTQLEKNLNRLVDEWQNRNPDWILKKLSEYLKYNQMVNTSDCHTNIGHLFYKLSEKVDNHVTWLNRMLDSDRAFNSSYFLPFIIRAIKTKKEKWEQTIRRVLSIEEHRHIVISSVIASSNVPPDLLNEIVNCAGEIGKNLIYMCLRNEIPVDTIKKLLKSSDPKVSGYTALGLWHQEPKGEIDVKLLGLWKNAIIKFNDYEEYLLCGIFESNPEITFLWLKNNIEKIADNVILLSSNSTVLKAIKNTRYNDKLLLLDHLESSYKYYEIVEYIVDNNTSLYKELLKKKELKDLHLGILSREKITPEWIELAEIALAHGYNPDDISKQLMYASREWCGKESEMWSKRIVEYANLLNHDNSGIKKIGENCLAYADNQKKSAENNEYNEDVFGR